MSHTAPTATEIATVLPPPSPVLAEVDGTAARFPVRRIFCVGRNYAAHRAEMGGDDRDPPFFFSKPADALVASGETIPYARATSDLHHEVELVIAIGLGGADIPVGEALGHIYGYAVGVDLTRRDLQAEAKRHGRPWDSAKAFDQSAPLGPIAPMPGAALDGGIRLSVNGTVRQSAKLGDMIWAVPEIIAECSRLWRLAPGDLIFTGTPEGVGPLVAGETVEAAIDGLPPLRFSIA
jgi:fumarylpyruvate hydrolase